MSNFPQRLRSRLVMAYRQQPLPLDRLPYTDWFDRVAGRVKWYAERIGTQPPTNGEIWRELARLRKNGTLPRKTNRRVSVNPKSGTDRKA